jgi:hypothetical protein
MNVPSPQAMPAHRAALSLHSLCEADRQWVLQALGGEQQAALQPLLQELEELGIPREPELAHAFAAEAPGKDLQGAGTLQALDACGVRRLGAVLVAEPPRLAAALLASGGWPWRECLLSVMPVGIARSVEGAIPAIAGAGALQAAVVAELAPVVREREDAVPQPSSLWCSLRRRFGARGAGR